MHLRAALSAAILVAGACFAATAATEAAKYSLKTEELAPASGTVKRVVLLLHASSSRNTDMLHIGATLRNDLPDTLLLAPDGPFPSDESGYHWFSEPSKVGAYHGALALNRFIDEVKARHHVQDSQIAIVGSSAGGMIALYTVLQHQEPMAAIVSFAGSLLIEPPYGNRTPICLIYGDKDQYFPNMTRSVQTLRNAHVPVEDHVRPGLGHEVDMPGVALAAQCLQKSFGINPN